MVAFGVGKRYCMGELLARNELFLFTVNLIQKLEFLPPVDNPPPNINQYYAGLTNIPNDFFVRVVDINK